MSKLRQGYIPGPPEALRPKAMCPLVPESGDGRMTIPTSEKLAQVLHAAGLFDMEMKAREGYYDDFRSPLATPIIQLVNDLRASGQHDLAARAINGEWDGTKEEGDEWFQREGHKLIPGSKP